jgi:hypothetical protein
MPASFVLYRSGAEVQGFLAILSLPAAACCGFPEESWCLEVTVPSD